jgi:hypothetical protein
MAEKVLAPAVEALALLGAGRDPGCWIAWGEDPAARYAILAPAPAGLAIVNVRVNVPGEGPRAGGKVTRWSRVQVGELSVEVQGGHRLITFQVESHLLHAADDEADEVASFAATIFAAIDGRWTTVSQAIALPAPTSVGSSSSSPEAVQRQPQPKAFDT